MSVEGLKKARLAIARKKQKEAVKTLEKSRDRDIKKLIASADCDLDIMASNLSKLKGVSNEKMLKSFMDGCGSPKKKGVAKKGVAPKKSTKKTAKKTATKKDGKENIPKGGKKMEIYNDAKDLDDESPVVEAEDDEYVDVEVVKPDLAVCPDSVMIKNKEVEVQLMKKADGSFLCGAMVPNAQPKDEDD